MSRNPVLQQTPRSPLLWLPLVVLLVGLLVTYTLWRDARATASQELKTEFDFLALEIGQQVQERISHYNHVLLALRGFFAGSNHVDRNEFHKYYQALDLPTNFPGISGIAYVPHVKHADKAAHVAAARQQGQAEYNIHPAGERASYAPVLFIEPLSGANVRALGYDVASETRRLEALERSRDANESIITHKIELVQDKGQEAEPGFLMMLPLYHAYQANDTVEARRANLVGWVDMVFRANELMQFVLGKKHEDLDIEIFDGVEMSEKSLLYDKDKKRRFAGNSDAVYQKTLQTEVAGQKWLFLVSSLPAFESQLNTERSTLMLQGGVVLSLMMALLSGALVRGRLNSIEASKAIRNELETRKQAEESLRQAAMVYESSSEGMMVTDEQNRIITINPAFTRLTGYTLDDIVGKDPSCMSSGRHDKDFYRVMWDAIKQTGHWQGEIWDRCKNGDIRPRYVTINTIYKDDGSVYRRVALFLDISAQKESEETIWRQANFDVLTGLPNRNMFHERLEQEIRQSHRYQHMFALLFIDLDLFKEVNDTLGHQKGDQLLIEAGQRIAGCVREADTVARLGGDEFTVILSELHDAGDIEIVTNNILDKLAEPYKLGEELVHVTGSIGITLYPRDATDADTLLKHADQAMYAAKSMGRNRSSYFTPALQEAAQNRLRLVNDLRTAIAEQQFTIHYQPIIDLKTNVICKAEALLRWQHPERGLVYPDDFISLAEETGLINKISDWVFMEAVHQAKRIRESYCPAFQISVNKSPREFREGSTSVRALAEHLRDLGLGGDSIVIEITEGLLLNPMVEVAERLEAFRAAGIQLAFDDFGTGYSSLAYLKRFDIDYVKIDRTFVRDIDTDPNDLTLSKAIIVMSHTLGLQVVAEGVETERQLQLLREAGCDFAQGNYLARPMPAEQLDALMQAKQAGGAQILHI